MSCNAVWLLFNLSARVFDLCDLVRYDFLLSVALCLMLVDDRVEIFAYNIWKNGNPRWAEAEAVAGRIEGTENDDLRDMEVYLHLHDNEVLPSRF